MDQWIWLSLPVISALIGYVTNWVAIRMLFRPYEEKRLWGVRVPFTPGLIPKRRGDLARSIGRSVSRYLLTHETIRARLQAPTFRTHVDQLVGNLIQQGLDRDLPSLNALVPEQFQPAWNSWKEETKGRLEVWVEGLLKNPQFCRLIETQTQAQLNAWLDAPLDSLFSQSALERAPQALAQLVQGVLSSPALQAQLDHFLSQRVETTLREDRPLSELLPQPLRDFILQQLEPLVPVLLTQLVQVLQNDTVRKHIKVHLFELVDDLLNRQFQQDSVWDQFKLGLMESFVISPEEIKARIEDAVDEIGPRLAQVLEREEVRGRVYLALGEAVERFWSRKLSEFNVSAETAEQWKRQLIGWFASYLKGPHLQEQLARWIGGYLTHHRQDSLRQLLPSLSGKSLDDTATRVSAALIQWLQGPDVRAKLTAFSAAQGEALLERPLGRLARFIPPSTQEQAKALAADKLLDLLVRQAPVLLEKLDIERIVSERVGKFSVEEVERLIVGITGNQLKAITWFGAVLGFLIGLLQLLLLVLSS